MFLQSSILLGFIRLSIILLIVFYINRKFINRKRAVNFLDFAATQWFRYGSIILLLLFLLVQLNAYNLFNMLFVLLMVIIVDLIGFKNLRNPRRFFNMQIKSSLLQLLRNIEAKKSVKFWVSLPAKKKKKKNHNWLILVLTILIGFITFISRYYFVRFDNYALTASWIEDLSKIIKFDMQLWFQDGASVDGELAMANLYSKVTDISPEIGLQVISILETTLLAVLIFWTINKLSPSKLLAPIIASVSFALIYVLTPLNVYYLLENNPTYMALTFALPMMVYFLKPELLRVNKFIYFLCFALVFFAIGLVDLFTTFILIPPFLIIGFSVNMIRYKLHNFLAILAYIFSTALLMFIYKIMCNNVGADYLTFLHSNILSISSYTYIPQLILPYAEIVKYFQFATIGGIALILVSSIIKRENWHSTIVFLLYFNFLILLTKTDTIWIDKDMINNSISVFMPLVFGLCVAIVFRIIGFIPVKTERFLPVTSFVVLIAMVGAVTYFQKPAIEKLTESDPTPKYILDAYDKISQTYFPYSYTVVNDPMTQIVSTNKHFFMNYEYFLNSYPKVDKIHFDNIKDAQFLVKNPEFALTNSVLVFVLNEKNKDEKNLLSENKSLSINLKQELQLLKSRGREVRVFYDNNILRVYEIVNTPKQSKVSDLIF